MYSNSQLNCSCALISQHNESSKCNSNLIAHFQHKIVSKYLKDHIKNVLQWKWLNYDCFLVYIIACKYPNLVRNKNIDWHKTIKHTWHKMTNDFALDHDIKKKKKNFNVI